MNAEISQPVPHVTLVSSFTVDRFPPDDDGRRRELTGGPAHYVGSALARLGVPYVLITGGVASVEVIPGPEGEHYLIPPMERISLPDRLTTPAVILSPIVGEIDPEAIPPIDGILAVDLQGFVRRPMRPTDERFEVDLTALLRRADVVKAAEAEINQLSSASLEAVLDTMLVQTHGARGATICDRGTTHEISARPVSASYSVGAGDTYLAAFVAGLLHGEGPAAAGEQAARFTEAFLRDRG
jgi:sugar/nucleoside kinase (ribokinase family)